MEIHVQGGSIRGKGNLWQMHEQASRWPTALQTTVTSSGGGWVRPSVVVNAQCLNWASGSHRGVVKILASMMQRFEASGLPLPPASLKGQARGGTRTRGLQ